MNIARIYNRLLPLLTGFPRIDSPEEVGWVAELLATTRPGTMIDVGSHYGESMAPFLAGGWKVLAFEPEPANFATIQTQFGHQARLLLDPRAIAARDGDVLTLYATPDSTGANSLSPFTPGHRPVAEVSTVRLDTVLREQKIEQVDFLKVDAEGHDLFVLRTYPFAQVPPEVVLCEFEDRKTVPLGYTSQDMVRFLSEAGYQVLISEWHPIVRYGVQHAWNRLALPPDQPASAGWGNLIACRSTDIFQRLLALARRFERWHRRRNRLRSLIFHRPSPNAPKTL